jgi:hypothetical protein
MTLPPLQSNGDDDDEAFPDSSKFLAQRWTPTHAMEVLHVIMPNRHTAGKQEVGMRSFW